MSGENKNLKKTTTEKSTVKESVNQTKVNEKTVASGSLIDQMIKNSGTFLPIIFIAVLFSSFFFCTVLFYKKFMTKIERFYLDNVEANLILETQRARKEKNSLIETFKESYLNPIETFLSVVGSCLMIAIIIQALLKRFVWTDGGSEGGNEKIKSLHFADVESFIKDFLLFTGAIANGYLMESVEGITFLGQQVTSENRIAKVREFKSVFEKIYTHEKCKKILANIFYDHRADFYFSGKIKFHSTYECDVRNDQVIFKKATTSNYLINLAYAFVEIFFKAFEEKGDQEKEEEFYSRVADSLKIHLSAETENYQKIHEQLSEIQDYSHCNTCSENIDYKLTRTKLRNRYGRFQVFSPANVKYPTHETHYYTDYSFYFDDANHKYENTLNRYPVCFNSSYSYKKNNSPLISNPQEHSYRIKDEVENLLANKPVEEKYKEIIEKKGDLENRKPMVETINTDIPKGESEKGGSGNSMPETSEAV